MPVTLRRDTVQTTGWDGGPMVGYGYRVEDPSRDRGIREQIDYGPRLWKKWGACTFDLVGESHHERELKDPSFQAGSRLIAVAEDNPYDPNAVAIWNARQTLHGGYIGRDHAPTARELLLLGVEWYVFWEWRVEGRRTGLRLIAAQPRAIRWPHETSVVWPPEFVSRPAVRPARSPEGPGRQARPVGELARESRRERRGSAEPRQAPVGRKGLLRRLLGER